MTPLMAAKAYGAVQKQMSALSNGLDIDQAMAEPKSASNDFSQVLKNTMDQTQKLTKNAESQMSLQAQGKTELIDAVTAVASAQANLEAVVAIRDQVISAYKEIMAMPI